MVDFGIGSVDAIAQDAMADSGEFDGVNVTSLGGRNGFIDTRLGEPCGCADVVPWSRSFGTEMCLYMENGREREENREKKREKTQKERNERK